MPHGITQCYLPPGRGDIPAFTPAEADTRLSDPGGMQGWVDLVGIFLIIVKYISFLILTTCNGTEMAYYVLMCR